MEKFTNDVYENSVGLAVAKKNIPYLRIAGDHYFQAGLGYRQRRFCCADINYSASARVARGKTLTRELLERCDVPIPRGCAINKIEELSAAYAKLTKPLVIKPVAEMCGRGITVNIDSIAKAESAFGIANKLGGKKIILEEQIAGEDHRLLVIGGKFIAGLKRTRAFVVGDGQSSIAELIQQENVAREKSDKYIKAIEIDDSAKTALADGGYNLQSVVKKDERVIVKMTGNVGAGGISENVTDSVCPENIDLVLRITRYFNLEIAGVDILSTDISKPLADTGGAVIEVNEEPGLRMHQEPYIGKPIMAAEILVNYIFPQQADAWIPIRLRGKEIREMDVIKKHLYHTPSLVKQLDSEGGDKDVVIDQPNQNLYSYLVDPLTKEVEIN
ncbi:MAG: hypothetical protein HQ530_01405 [Parcubacteria group bacterium]|nr:hypothetical protein [Parcubacteria group bacterium]